MKPIDSVTGLPRSAEVARMMSTQVRHGEVAGQGQTLSFAREMKERQNTVAEAPKSEKGTLDTEGGGGEGGAYYSGSGGKQAREEDVPGKDDEYPGKGKILDIRGSD